MEYTVINRRDNLVMVVDANNPYKAAEEAVSEWTSEAVLYSELIRSRGDKVDI